MNHVFNLLFISLLLVNLTGLSLAGQILTKLPYGLARAVVVGGGCALFFFIEHYIGLGGLSWLLPLSTAGAVYVIWRYRSLMLENLWGEAFFLLGFGYALAWRYAFPDIDASSEKLADLNFIAGYMAGAQLPPIDPWLSPYRLTQYYSFQHYCAALMGRILNIAPGTAYNIGYCVIVGLVMAPASEFIRKYTASRATQCLILCGLLFGGTGASLFTPFIVNENFETQFSSMRFIGSADADDKSANGEDILTPLGNYLREKMYGPGEMTDQRREGILEMPMEIFAYVVQLGDYHAPLGGYVLLATALASFAVLASQPGRKASLWAAGAMMATIPFLIATNTWNLPLHGILVAGCLVFLWRYRQLPPWPELIAVTFIGWVLMYPYLTYFLPRSIGGAIKFDLVTKEQHAPLISYLIQLWPLWSVTLLGFFAFPKKQREFLWFPILACFLLVMMELVNVDDLYSGRFERFNTTLKWWPWVAFFCMLALTTLNLRSKESPYIVRIGTLAVIFGTLAFPIILVKTWWKDFDNRRKSHILSFGQLDGAGWLRKKDLEAPAEPAKNGGPGVTITHGIMNYLQANPRGVVLECPNLENDAMAFMDTGALPLFTGNPTVYGWPGHQQLWRGYQPDVERRWIQGREFFQGKLENPLDYLERHNVQYILWPGSLRVDAELFDQIKGQIESRYLFIPMDGGDPRRGIWQRRS